MNCMHSRTQTLCLFLLVALCFNVAQSAKLVRLISVVRNGARTPRETFNKESWGGLESDSLTTLGAQQMFLLGKWTQQFYIHESDLYEKTLGTSSGTCSKDKIHVLFSCEERTIQSGLNFLRGLCRNYDDIYQYVIEKYLVNQISNSTEKALLLNSSGNHNIDGGLSSCALSTEQEFYFLSKADKCPRILIERQEIWQSPKFQSRLAQIKSIPEYGILLAIINRVHSRPQEENDDIYDLVALSKALSEHNSYMFHGKTSPYRFTAHQITLLYEIAGIVHFELLNGGTMQTNIQGSFILQNLKDLALDLSAKNSTRLLQQTQAPTNPAQVIKEIKALEKVEGDLVEKLTEDIKDLNNKTSLSPHKSYNNHTIHKQNDSIIHQDLNSTNSTQNHHKNKTLSSPSQNKSQNSTISNNSSESSVSIIEVQSSTQSQQSFSSNSQTIQNTKNVTTKNETRMGGNQSNISDSSKQNRTINMKNETEKPQIETIHPKVNSSIPLFNEINKKITPAKLPLEGITLISAKESTLITLLRLFSLNADVHPMETLPNFSSQINIEYWHDDQNQLEIIVKYNQKKIRTFKECSKTNAVQSQCLDFISFLDNHIVRDLQEVCESKL